MKKLLLIGFLIIASIAIGCAQKETTIHVVYDDSVFQQRILSRIDAIKDSIDNNWKCSHKIDTIRIIVHDTVLVTKYDTVRIMIHDTIYIVKSDTIIVTPEDTTVVIPDTTIRYGYFVSNDGDDNNVGNDVTKPWRTLNKALNSGSGTIYLKAGNVFRESVVLNNKSNITIDRYGVGENPVINGGQLLSNWKQITPNIYKARLPQYYTNIWFLKINGHNKIVGRTPNDDQMYYFTAYGSTSNVTDVNHIQSDGYWNGADIYARCQDWTSNRTRISNYSNGVFTLSPSLANGSAVNNYYLICNHVNTLDQQGEWCYNRSDTSVYVYNTGNINDSVVECSVGLNLVTLLNCDNIHFSNIHFTTSNGSGIAFNTSKNIQISSCSFDYLLKGVESTQSTYSRVNKNIINECLDKGIDLHATRVIRVHDNTISNINVHHGQYSVSAMGRGISVLYSYIGSRYVGCDSTLVYRNRIDKTAEGGIVFAWANNTKIDSNYVTNACWLISDYGGIYNVSNAKVYWNGSSKWNPYGNHIGNNYINQEGTYSNGIGRTSTTSYSYLTIYGIYADNNSAEQVIENNVVIGGRSSILLHRTDSIRVFKNIAVNSVYAAFYTSGNGGGRTRYNTINNNVWVSLQHAGYNSTSISPFRSSNSTLVGNTYNGNYYLLPNNNSEGAGNFIYIYNNGSFAYNTISAWQSASGAINERTDVIKYTGTVGIDNMYFVYYNNSSISVRLYDVHPLPLRNLDGTKAEDVWIKPYTGVIYINN